MALPLLCSIAVLTEVYLSRLVEFLTEKFHVVITDGKLLFCFACMGQPERKRKGLVKAGFPRACFSRGEPKRKGQGGFEKVRKMWKAGDL